MTTIVSIDKAGRIVIPKKIRDAQRIRPGSRFLLAKGPNGVLRLQRLDPDVMARQIREELRGIDLRPIISKVEAEIERIAASSHPSLRRKPTTA